MRAYSLGPDLSNSVFFNQTPDRLVRPRRGNGNLTGHPEAFIIEVGFSGRRMGDCLGFVVANDCMIIFHILVVIQLRCVRIIQLPQAFLLERWRRRWDFLAGNRQ